MERDRRMAPPEKTSHISASMELDSIELHRIGPHQSTSLTLTRGLNLIYGPNASGKSSIVNALYFALTGQTLQPTARPSDFATHGADTGSVRLLFRSGPKRYALSRTTSGEAELHELGRETRLLARTPQMSRLAIQRMLALEPGRLALAHFLREEELGHFLSQTAGQRKNLLRTALNLDKWERSLKIYREARRLARNRFKELGAALRQMEEPLEGPANRLKEMRAELRDHREERRALLKSDGGGHLEELGRIQSRYLTLHRELDEILFPLSSIERLNRELEQLDKKVARLTTLESDIAFGRQRLGELRGLQQSITSDLARLQSLLDAGERECPTCEQRLELPRIQTLIEQKKMVLQRIGGDLRD